MDVITKFFDSALSKQPLGIYGDSSQKRDFINLADVVEGLYAALTVKGVERGFLQHWHRQTDFRR